VLLFVLRRLLWTIPILFVVLTLTFFLVRGIAGDPFRHGPLVGLGAPAWAKYNDPKPPSIRANLERRFGLDLPWYQQYGNYLLAVATWNFGPSTTYRDRTVNDIIREQAPNSLLLGVLAFGFAVTVGVPLGLLAALRAGSATDVLVRFVSAAGLAVPVFLVATLLIYLFSVELGWLPTSGWSQSAWSKVLPAVSLGLLPLAYLVRLVRASVLDVVGADHVRAAAAKGLRRRAVVSRHVLRNALIPVVTAAGPMLGVLVTGSFVVESIFAIPGIGRYFVSSVVAKDLPVVLGISVLLTVAIVTANLLVDVAHALLDPRVRERR
jgi:oligopeptide transport system permease protein